MAATSITNTVYENIAQNVNPTQITPERGAVAFSKTGDPQFGEWGDAVILGRYCDVPDYLAPHTSA
jgi:hypothetical protein